MFARRADLRGTMLFGSARLHSGSLGHANSCLVWCHIGKAAQTYWKGVAHLLACKDHRTSLVFSTKNETLFIRIRCYLMSINGTNGKTGKSFQNHWSLISEKLEQGSFLLYLQWKFCLKAMFTWNTLVIIAYFLVD